MQGSTFSPSSVGWMPRIYWLTLKNVHAAVPVGKPLQGSVLPLAAEGAEVNVQVVMG